MPSLFRFLFVVALLAGAGYGAIYALAYYTNPKPREITVIIPPNQLNRHRPVGRPRTGIGTDSASVSVNGSNRRH